MLGCLGPISQGVWTNKHAACWMSSVASQKVKWWAMISLKHVILSPSVGSHVCSPQAQRNRSVRPKCVSIIQSERKMIIHLHVFLYKKASAHTITPYLSNAYLCQGFFSTKTSPKTVSKATSSAAVFIYSFDLTSHVLSLEVLLIFPSEQGSSWVTVN